MEEKQTGVCTCRRGHKSQCPSCHRQACMQFVLRKIHSMENMSGGMTIFLCVPKYENKRIRLHHLTNFVSKKEDNSYWAFWKKGHNLPAFEAVKTWEEIWSRGQGWGEPPTFFARGKLTRGIVTSHGNGMCAAAEYQGQLYAIEGGWS